MPCPASAPSLTLLLQTPPRLGDLDNISAAQQHTATQQLLRLTPLLFSPPGTAAPLVARPPSFSRAASPARAAAKRPDHHAARPVLQAAAPAHHLCGQGRGRCHTGQCGQGGRGAWAASAASRGQQIG